MQNATVIEEAVEKMTVAVDVAEWVALEREGEEIAIIRETIGMREKTKGHISRLGHKFTLLLRRLT